MSLSFNGTTSALALSTTTFVTAYPFSLFIWVKPNAASLAASGMVFGVGDFGGNNEAQIHADGTVAGEKLKAFTRTGTNSVTAISTDGMVEDVWIPVLAVFTAANSRTIYAGAGAPVTETTANLTTPFSFDRVVVGKRAKDDTLWFSGLLAHATAWDIALDQDDFDALAGGAVPSTVQPEDLIEYWSLATQAATQTGVNGLVLTASNTSQGADDPLGPSSELSGGVTLDQVVAAGSLGSSASDLSGGVTLDAVVAAGTLGGQQPGMCVVPGLRNWNGSLATSEVVPWVTFCRLADAVQVLIMANVAAHASTADISVTDAALIPGTWYMAIGFSADGSKRFAAPVQAT